MAEIKEASKVVAESKVEVTKASAAASAKDPALEASELKAVVAGNEAKAKAAAEAAAEQKKQMQATRKAEAMLTTAVAVSNAKNNEATARNWDAAVADTDAAVAREALYANLPKEERASREEKDRVRDEAEEGANRATANAAQAERDRKTNAQELHKASSAVLSAEKTEKAPTKPAAAPAKPVAKPGANPAAKAAATGKTKVALQQSLFE